MTTLIDPVTGQRWSYNKGGGMDSTKAGLGGATPEVAVKPVDESLPQCKAKMPGVAFVIQCARKQGHYGQHGAKLVSGGEIHWEGGAR